MMLDAATLDWQALNEAVRDGGREIEIMHCTGERFIGAGAADKKITIHGVPGNALGAYLDGGEIIARENVQDAVGDTMNDGRIVVHGSAGDALGYAMRGGRILVRGDAGYRTGIHMKQYQEKRPVIVVGGRVGSFLGEYLAGGLIIVLGLGCSEVPAGNFIGTGMHSGEIWLRSPKPPRHLPPQVHLEQADREMLAAILPQLEEFSTCFDLPMSQLTEGSFYRLTPNAQNPYKQLYVQN